MLNVIFLLLTSVFIRQSIAYTFDIKGEAYYGYYLTAKLGTPSQDINLLVDTGSSNTAVAVRPTVNKAGKYFKINESSTFHPTELKISLQYTGGSWTGYLATDVLNLCFQNNCTVVTNIACMTSFQDIFQTNSPFQGTLGLAYSELARPDASIQTYFETFTETKNISNVFAVLLCGPFLSSTEATTSCGKLHVGYIPSDYFLGTIMYTPILKEWYYEVMLTQMKVGDFNLPFECQNLNKYRTIIDTGTTHISFPEEIYHWTIKKMKEHIKIPLPNGFWYNQSLTCVPNGFDKLTLPNITLSFYHTQNSSFDLVISPELYILRIPFNNQECAVLAIGMSKFGTTIGATILKGFYVVFNRQMKSVGFANATFSTNSKKFLSLVSVPVFVDKNLSKCKTLGYSDDTKVSAFTIVLLCFAVVFAIVLLYMLISWMLQTFVFDPKRFSDTRNLVDDDDDDT